MNKPKITLPKPRYMDEVPDCSFRYIFRDGTFSMHTYASGFHEKSPNVIGWIPAKVKVEEQIVPGWCEFENPQDKKIKQVFWRYSDGALSYNAKGGKLIDSMLLCWEFVCQLTHEPNQDDMAERTEQLKAELKKPKWQPINTAPKDGTKILLMDEDGDVRSAWWYVCPKDGQGNWKNLTHEDMDIDWKRWMPIPPID